MSRRRRLLAAAGALLLLGAGAWGAFAWWRSGLDGYTTTPFGSSEPKLVEVLPGARMREAARALERAGVVSDAARLEWLARETGLDRRVRAGEYEFSGPWLPQKVLEALAAGRVKLHRCTVPEGLRSDEVALLLQGCGFGQASDLLRLARDPAFARSLGLPGDSLEGYLFPDTYTFPKGPSAEAVLRKMVAGFHAAMARAEAHRKPGVDLDQHQTATLASIVEKETAVPEERAHVSCVFHNRLKKGMRLETDPTVIYAKILRTGGFDGESRSLATRTTSCICCGAHGSTWRRQRSTGAVPPSHRRSEVRHACPARIRAGARAA